MASSGCRCFFSINVVVSLVLLLLAATAPVLPASAANSTRQLNKPSLKTVQSPDGDIIDCVPSHLQPAFDHPRLKGLKPLDPPERPKGHKTKAKTSGIIQVWKTSGEACPEGTVPIRRTKEEDMRVKRFGRKLVETTPPLRSPPINHEYSFVTVKDRQVYYGAEAIYNVWAPFVENANEFSLSQVWLTSGTYENGDLNTIEGGWQVLHGNQYPRFFIYWTADAYQNTGCYNLECPGFVQTNNDIVIGGSISTTTSAYSGDQVTVSLLVSKDNQTGNWWLEFNSDTVGYWPSTLFTHLADSATEVQFGGEIVNNSPSGHHTATQMGSGRFAEEGFHKAAFIRNLTVIDSNNALKQVNNLSPIVTNPKCYDIAKGVDSAWGTSFFFGGPGRSDQCP